MSDFIVRLPESDERAASRDLDWDETRREWTLSEKEYGDATWSLDGVPSSDDLASLRDFFLIGGRLDSETLSSLSPGEFAALHSAASPNSRIVATICGDCKKHWIVYRLDGEGVWRKFGRSCGFVWFRGEAVDTEVDPVLAQLLDVKSDV